MAVFKQKIEEQFRRISEVMIASSKIGQSATKHADTKGRNAERVLIDFLGRFLPRRYSLCQGQIVSPVGSLSKQLDVIIYDDTTYPAATVLESGEKVVFAHSVYAVISVKSSLFESKGIKSQTQELVENLRSVFKIQCEANEVIKLRRNSNSKVDILCFGFAFLNNEADIERKLNAPQLQAREFLAALSILKSEVDEAGGFYMNPHFCVHRDQDQQFVRVPEEENALLVFYRTLFNLLCLKDIVELGDQDETRKTILAYKPWGEWGFSKVEK